MLQRFDECDFLLSASEDPRGALIVLRYDDHSPLSPLLFFLRDACAAQATTSRSTFLPIDTSELETDRGSVPEEGQATAGVEGNGALASVQR